MIVPNSLASRQIMSRAYPRLVGRSYRLLNERNDLLMAPPMTRSDESSASSAPRDSDRLLNGTNDRLMAPPTNLSDTAMQSQASRQTDRQRIAELEADNGRLNRRLTDQEDVNWMQQWPLLRRGLLGTVKDGDQKYERLRREWTSRGV